jgi:hypothetical protein
VQRGMKKFFDGRILGSTEWSRSVRYRYRYGVSGLADEVICDVKYFLFELERSLCYRGLEMYTSANEDPGLKVAYGIE